MTFLNASAIATQYLSDSDLMGLVPKWPKFIEELCLIPVGEEGVLIIGGVQSKFIRSEGAVLELIAHLNSIDGTKSLEDYLSERESQIGKTRFELLCLLDRYGFLENQVQVGEPITESDSQTAGKIFFNRYLSSSRINKSSDQAINRINLSKVVFCVPEILKERFRKALRASNISNFDFSTEMRLIADTNYEKLIGLSIRVSGLDEEVNQSAEREWHEKGVHYFGMELGKHLARIGPYCIPNKTASLQCAKSQLSRLSPVEDLENLDYWIEVFVHELVLILSRLASDYYLNSIQQHYLDFQGKRAQRVKICAVPGGELSGLVSRKALNISDRAFQVWKHHIGTRLPPRDFLGPGNHLYHYSIDNLVRYNAKHPQFSGQPAEVINDNLELKAAWLRKEEKQKKVVGFKEKVLQIMQISVGNYGPNFVSSRRISPSGGGLRSVTAIVSFFRLDGVAELFSYDQSLNIFRKIQINDHVGLLKALGEGGDLRELKCSVFFISNVKKVREKYGDFGLNVAYLDTGVSYRFAIETAISLGLAVADNSVFSETEVARLLRIENSSDQLIITARMDLSDSTCPSYKSNRELISTFDVGRELIGEHPFRHSVPNNFEYPAPSGFLVKNSFSDDLLEILRARRARYSFANASIPLKTLEELVKIGGESLEHLTSSGFPQVRIFPYLVRSVGDKSLESGLYKLSWDGKISEKKSNLNSDDIGEFINQETLSKASSLLTIMFDFEHAITTYGPPGYKFGLIAAGSILTRIWLAATAIKLVGTTAGGVLEHGYQKFGGIDGYSETPIFSLALGFENKR